MIIIILVIAINRGVWRRLLMAARRQASICEMEEQIDVWGSKELHGRLSWEAFWRYPPLHRSRRADQKLRYPKLLSPRRQTARRDSPRTFFLAPRSNAPFLKARILFAIRAEETVMLLPMHTSKIFLSSPERERTFLFLFMLRTAKSAQFVLLTDVRKR